MYIQWTKDQKENAIMLSAQAWCTDNIDKIEMNNKLCLEFANILLNEKERIIKMIEDELASGVWVPGMRANYGQFAEKIISKIKEL